MTVSQRHTEHCQSCIKTFTAGEWLPNMVSIFRTRSPRTGTLNTDGMQNSRIEDAMPECLSMRKSRSKATLSSCHQTYGPNCDRASNIVAHLTQFLAHAPGPHHIAHMMDISETIQLYRWMHCKTIMDYMILRIVSLPLRVISVMSISAEPIVAK